MSETEMNSRREILFENYRKIKNIEAKVMLEMTVRDIIPAVSDYLGVLGDRINARAAISKNAVSGAEKAIYDKLSELLDATYEAYLALERVEKTAITKSDDEESSFYYKNNVIPKMNALRKLVDTMETLCAREYWPMPTYGDILFRI